MPFQSEKQKRLFLGKAHGMKGKGPSPAVARTFIADSEGPMDRGDRGEPAEQEPMMIDHRVRPPRIR